MNPMEAFILEAAKIAERQAESDKSGAESGFYYCTPLEAGILLDPSTPAHIAQACTQIRYTNTPEGIALWEKGALETQHKLQQLTGRQDGPPIRDSESNSFPSIALTT